MAYVPPPDAVDEPLSDDEQAATLPATAMATIAAPTALHLLADVFI
jgi:hypothetical protein